MKKNLLSAVLTAGFVGFSLPAMAVPVSAEIIGSGECGENLTWTLDDSGTLTISGEGEMWDYGGYYDDETGEYIGTPWHEATLMLFYEHDADGNYLTDEDNYLIPTGTEIHVIIEEGVTSVGTYAFSDLPITSVSMPDSMLIIGDDAFSHDDIVIELPPNLVEIGECAFWGCANEEITFPETLKRIGLWAFRDSNLTEITLPANLEQIGEEAFSQTNLTSVTVLNPNLEFPTWTDEETGEQVYLPVFSRFIWIEPESDLQTPNSSTTIVGNTAITITDLGTIGGCGMEVYDSIIYGYTNSTAQAYAEYMLANKAAKYDYTFIALDAEETESSATETSSDSSDSASTAVTPPQTGDNSIALALAGLLTAAGAAFVLRKKD